MPCGVVLREALKHEAITAVILHDESRGNEKAANIDQIDPEVRQSGEGVFWKFFPWIDKGAFEVSTDAFTTFRVSHYKAPRYFLVVVLTIRQGLAHETQAACCAISLKEF